MLLKQVMKRLGAWISGSEDKSKEKSQAEWQAHGQYENKAGELEAAELAKYETRRQEIAESAEQINGIFCIYEGTIIPDYFSEYLASDKNSPKERVRYHSDFFKNYIKHKYPDLSLSDTYLPHGRVELIPGRTDIFIDKCYFYDEGMINHLRELYRITEQINVIWNGNYKCHVCKNMDNGGRWFQSYYVGDPR